MFKKVNDLALISKFEGLLSQQDFQALFLNKEILKQDVADKKAEAPSLEEICMLFEFLDEDRTGMISAKDFMNYLELCERLKSSQFDMQKYKDNQSIKTPALENKLALMEKEVEELISSFDLTGDKLIGPEEFYNIIIYAYTS